MTISTLLTDLATVTHGTNINKVPNIYGIINRAARAVLLDVDPKETTRIVQMPQIFNSVFEYALPADVKGDRITDLRVQAGRTPWDIFTQTYAETFDSTKLTSFTNEIYTQWNTGVKTVRINAPFLTSPVTLSDTSSTTGWAATSGASSITLDSTNYVAGGGALQFNLLASVASGYIETSTISPVDLTSYINVGTGFLWVYLPTGASVTSINVRWGTDSSNYYNYSATTAQQGTAFVNGWNLIALPWVSATKVGSPTATSYKYTRVTLSYNSTLQTGVKICNLVFTLGYYFDIQYYSKYLFRDPSTNAFQENVTDVNDNTKLINLDTESYNLLFNKCAFFVAQTLQGADASYDADYWQTEYVNALQRYRAQNPSEAKNKRETYYKLPRKGYNRFYTNLFNR